MRKPGSKDFEPYKTRPMRLSDETWEKLKSEKEKFGKNWEHYIKELLNKK